MRKPDWQEPHDAQRPPRWIALKKNTDFVNNGLHCACAIPQASGGELQTCITSQEDAPCSERVVLRRPVAILVGERPP